ncbi:MAG TPA: DUF4912 domain-containing protein [Spirochaetales bacterium]|nr:DUF4912 domain-containing protein [Spirochaetales bacterium]HOV39123.1 DUF4912 domain-containing protein [Spirochaetales bacterium]
MNRKRLEALPEEILRKLLEQEGIEVPEDVERILLIDALLEILEEKLEEQELQNNNLVQVSQKKYDLTLPELIDTDDVAIEPLPMFYPETKIQFLLRDPFWAFVYWDVKAESLSALKREEGAEKFILRILQLQDIPRDSNPGSWMVVDFFDIELGCKDYSWYINLPVQDASYCAELVLQGKQKEKALARSNVQYVPRGFTLEELLYPDGSKPDPVYALMELDKMDNLYTKRSVPPRSGIGDQD